MKGVEATSGDRGLRIHRELHYSVYKSTQRPARERGEKEARVRRRSRSLMKSTSRTPRVRCRKEIVSLRVSHHATV